MAGGPSIPALAAAVSNAGALGFLAAGYKSVDSVRHEVAELRSLLSPDDLPYGVNVFVPSRGTAGADEVSAYRDRLEPEARRRDVALGAPRWDDDGYDAKVALLCDDPVPVASFTFGCPTAADVDRLHASGSAVWITVTTVDEAQAAFEVGADALVVQGVEAGGHRGGFDDAQPGDIGVLALLQLITGALDGAVPLIASGGLSTGRGVAAALATGAAAAQVGTAFLLAEEAGTGETHRTMISTSHRSTALTRAFTGRTARAISNAFLAEHSDAAPSAYPQVHHLTAPLRAAARSAGDAEGCHLWAGQAYELSRSAPAADIVEQLADDARQALREVTQRLLPDAHARS